MSPSGMGAAKTGTCSKAEVGVCLGRLALMQHVASLRQAGRESAG